MMPITRFFPHAVLVLAATSLPLECARGAIRTASETVEKTPRGLSRTLAEIQNRHGGILNIKLTELINELMRGDMNMQRYFSDNKSRKGSTIYAAALGEAGDKTIRLVYYAATDTKGEGGAVLSKIKSWVFTQVAAVDFAARGQRLIEGAGGGDFSVTANFRDDLVELLVHRTGSPVLTGPIRGEAASFR